jgi:ABC-type multidrug transport system fused ATPase/permease subunit
VGMLLAIMRRARRAFVGSIARRLGVVVAMAVLTGAVAGLLPAVVGRAVSAVAGMPSHSAPSGFSALIARVMPGGSTWGVVLFTLVATVVTIGIGVLSSKMGTALSGDVTAAVRIELMGAVLGASPRDVAEAGRKIGQPSRPPGMGPPGAKAPPGKSSPPAGPGQDGATQAAVVRLAVSREAALVSDFAVSVSTGLPQSIATLTVLGVELISAGAWLVFVGGIGLFLASRIAADSASRRVGLARRELQNADAAVFGNLQQTLSATEDLRLWGAREQAVGEFAEIARQCAAARERFATALAISGQIKSVFTAMAPLLIIVALKVSGRTYDAGAVAELLLLVPLLMIRLQALDGIRQGLIERGPVIEAAHRLMTLNPAPPRAADPVELDLATIEGRIEFDDVSFTPPGAARPVIDAVSLEIPAGAVVGICGPSGSGKSSLLRLLLRLDEPNGGTILLDGVRIIDIEPDLLPRIFGVVRQTAQMLERSVRGNLSLGLDPKPSDATLREALTAVSLDELASPDGQRDLATDYRKNPPNFSGGEHRRLLMARMLVQDAPVGILDEPEAGLPSATAEDILRTVVAQARGRTHLVVTHAPHLLDSDFNIVMDRGKIVARGTHDELAAGCDVYRDLLADALKDDHS